MGSPSASEVGEVLSRNVFGSGSECGSLIAEVEELVVTLTNLFQKAMEESARQGRETAQISPALATFASEAQQKLEKVVASSFRVFDAHDPRPHARKVQKEEMCKVIKSELAKEVQFQVAQTEYYGIGSDAGYSQAIDAYASQVVDLTQADDCVPEEIREAELTVMPQSSGMVSPSFCLFEAAATPACESVASSAPS